jgi:hypothetical protein
MDFLRRLAYILAAERQWLVRLHRGESGVSG